jgi:hypothetical protein
VRGRVALVSVALVASLVVYAVVAVTRHWWPSAAVAPLLAVLLWRRHRRARFTAYVFFSVLAARGLLTGLWGLPAYAVAAVGLLQTPAAFAAWPRLQPGRVRGTAASDDDPGRDDRMRPA